MRNTALQAHSFDLSAMRVRELESFCLQYREKKERLRDLLTRTPGARLSLAPSRSGPADPTAEAAVTIIEERLMRDLEDIEAAAEEVARGLGGGDALSHYLLRYLTAKKKPPLDSLPCGRRQFYNARKAFFAVLDGRRAAYAEGGEYSEDC